MPRLPTYTAQVQGVGGLSTRQATAADLTSAAAVYDLAAGASKEAEALLTTVEDAEQRKIITQNMQNRATYAKRLDEAATTGEDIDKIREEFDNQQSHQYDDLKTRKGRDAADYYTAQSGAMFQEKANSIRVEREVADARLKGQQFLDSAAATVGSNPSALPVIEQNIDAFVGTLTQVSPQERNRIANSLKQNINASAAMASARSRPEETLAAVKGGAFYLTPQQREQVINEAQGAIATRRTQESYERTIKELDKRERDDTARDSYLKSIFKGTFNPQAALVDNNLTPQTREHLMVFAESWAKHGGKEQPSNQKVVNSIWQAVHNPDAEARLYNTDAIFRYVETGDLNHSDAGKLMNDIANMRDVNNVKLSTKLRSQVGIIDQQLARDLRYKMRPELMASIKMNYVARVEDRMAELRSVNKNPAQVFDRDNKLYVGTREFIQGAIDEARRGPSGQVQSLNAPVQFPDGKWRIYKGAGDIEDVEGSWKVVDPAELARAKNPTGSALVEQIPE